MLTLTAPGAPGHREFIPNTPGQHGVCGCEVGDDGLVLDVGGWNASAGQRWNRLAVELRRRLPDLAYWRAVEVQRRGALHLHVLLASQGALDAPEVRRLAMAAGFGCNVRWDPLRGHPAGAARYVAKYVTKGASDRWTVPWRRDLVDKITGELTTQTYPTYRAWSCSRSWGITMAELRTVAAQAIEASRVTRWNTGIALVTIMLGAKVVAAERDP